MVAVCPASLVRAEFLIGVRSFSLTAKIIRIREPSFTQGFTPSLPDTCFVPVIRMNNPHPRANLRTNVRG
jgi:hypothetical protein